MTQRVIRLYSMRRIKTKKICHLTTVHSANDPRIFHKEILSLANEGYLVEFVVKKNKIEFEHPNIKYRFLENRSGLYGRVKNVIQCLRLALKADASLYHFHDPELIFVGLILKLFYRKMVIYDIHEIYWDAITYKPYLTKKVAIVLSFIYSIIDKVSSPFFDALILAEEGYTQYYKQRNFIVIQNFIPSIYILSNKKKKENLSGNKIDLVYLGGITRTRGALEMINLIHLLRDSLPIHLHLIGPIETVELEKELNKNIRRRNLSDHVKIYGYLPYTSVQEMLYQFDVGLIFLHPIVNNMTILPTKMFEYMANGMAVLMNNFPLWVKFNEKYKIGLTVNIFNINPNEIIEFLSNKKRLREIGKRNLRTVKENFVWEIEEKKLLSLYKKLHSS